MRLSTSFWVSAYVRQAHTVGDFTAVTRKGADQGGAIFVAINRLDGTCDLYGPAPQALLDGETDDRVFYCVKKRCTGLELHEKLEKEAQFDSDIWVIERESKEGQHDLMLADLSSER